jgi:phospholipid/cholesterol/gamma-HCH transport system permease protein
MEASTLTTRRLQPGSGPNRGADREPGLGETFAEGIKGPVRGILEEAGEMLSFGGRAFLELRGVWRYSAEVFRQAGILIVGSAMIIWFMEFIMGLECGIEANYVLRGYGASIYSGVFTAWCAIREMAPYMWGYILAAKVGCGLVAEIGSMRINDEIDALESQGVNPMRYLIATRLAAALLTFPFIYIVGLGFHFLANYFVIVVQIHEVSRGGWELVHWSFQNPTDILFSEIKIMFMGIAIVLVGMYYGFKASGGPVGVGNATARSMILNLILIHIIGSLGTMVFWGLSPNAPIGG